MQGVSLFDTQKPHLTRSLLSSIMVSTGINVHMGAVPARTANIKGEDIMQAELKKTGVSVGSWMGTQFLLAIPVVNIVVLIVLIFTCKNRSKRNFCIAALIWSILLALAFIAAIIFFGPLIVSWCERISTSIPI